MGEVGAQDDVRNTPESDGLAAGEANALWALRDVSFKVKRGEVLGVIGRNGAGKSTLLKILTRITEPTSGRAVMRGRVASLLEVGTGFHPELTGRENVYLNGAILGMKRVETARKFDEIVAFAEVEKFIDTPVKRYSSGMYVRLAFAVAAHLEPEILLVDEVLAVGDAGFQEKCLGKMKDVADTGRTVLFVSHNMGAINGLCQRAILLDAGALVADGATGDVVHQYLSRGRQASANVVLPTVGRMGLPARFTRLWIEDETGQPSGHLDVRKAFHMCSSLVVESDLVGVDVSVRVSNSTGHPLFTTSLSDSVDMNGRLRVGEHVLRAKVPGLFLAPGDYYATVAVHRPGVENIDVSQDELSFQVAETGSPLWQFAGYETGSVLVQCDWSLSG